MTGSTAHTPEAAAEYYKSEGYCLTGPIIPNEMVTAAVAHMNAVIDGTYETGKPPLSVNWRPGDDPAKLIKVDQPQAADETLAELITHPAIGRWAAALHGAPEIYAWAVQLLYKPSSETRAANVGWHQDDDYWQSWWDGEVFTCWLALSDVSALSGPVRFVKGSHLWGFQGRGDFFEGDLRAVRERYRVPEGKSWQEDPAVLAPGAASFHHRLTLHGSGPNLTDEPRRGLAIHLRTHRARELPGSAWHRAIGDDDAYREVQVRT